MLIILFVEVGIASIAVILFLCAFLYYSSTFVEERISAFTKFLKIFTVVILALSFLFPLSSFPNSVFFMVFFNNLMWVILVYRGFPLMNYVQPEFFLGFGSTVFSHLFLMLHFLRSSPKSAIITISYFILYVWLIPILIITSLSAVEDNSTNQPTDKPADPSKPKSKSFIKKFFDRMLKKAEDVLPHTGDKFD